jgi:hypothetical protein
MRRMFKGRRTAPDFGATARKRAKLRRVPFFWPLPHCCLQWLTCRSQWGHVVKVRTASCRWFGRRIVRHEGRGAEGFLLLDFRFLQRLFRSAKRPGRPEFSRKCFGFRRT